MTRFRTVVALWVAVLSLAIAAPFADSRSERERAALEPAISNAESLVTEGQRVFRFDTFGDEQFWGGALKLHEAIAGARFGGVGPGVSPATALAVGLKVDSEALPQSLLQAIQRGSVDLNDPASTLALLQANAVVGITGFFDGGRFVVDRNPVLAVPLGRGQLAWSRHRSPARRMAQS